MFEDRNLHPKTTGVVTTSNPPGSAASPQLLGPLAKVSGTVPSLILRVRLEPWPTPTRTRVAEPKYRGKWTGRTRPCEMAFLCTVSKRNKSICVEVGRPSCSLWTWTPDTARCRTQTTFSPPHLLHLDSGGARCFNGCRHHPESDTPSHQRFLSGSPRSLERSHATVCQYTHTQARTIISQTIHFTRQISPEYFNFSSSSSCLHRLYYVLSFPWA
ncbi:hypothetical protein VTO42DRAFT_5862 [Malbranchea cinnamomea]